MLINNDKYYVNKLLKNNYGDTRPDKMEGWVITSVSLFLHPSKFSKVKIIFNWQIKKKLLFSQKVHIGKHVCHGFGETSRNCANNC